MTTEHATAATAAPRGGLTRVGAERERYSAIEARPSRFTNPGEHAAWCDRAAAWAAVNPDPAAFMDAVTFTATQARTLLALIEDAEQVAADAGANGSRYTELYTIIDAAIIR